MAIGVTDFVKACKQVQLSYMEKCVLLAMAQARLNNVNVDIAYLKRSSWMRKREALSAVQDLVEKGHVVEVGYLYKLMWDPRTPKEKPKEK